MDIEILTTVFREFGLGISLTIVGALLLIMLIRFFLKQWDKILTRETEILRDARQERQQFQVTLDGYLTTLKEHSSDASYRYKRTEEANKYQREEHLKMLESLNSICANVKLGNQSLENAVDGFKVAHSQRAEESKAIIDSLKEVVRHCVECGKVLSKMNGHI